MGRKSQTANAAQLLSSAKASPGMVVGKEVAQVHLSPLKARWDAPKRLAGFVQGKMLER